MASTYRPWDSLLYCKRFIKNMPLDRDIGPIALDDINKIMWMAAPWRWTLGGITPINLVAGTSDYTFSPPNDFLYLYEAFSIDTSAVQTPRDLYIEPRIVASGKTIGQQTRIAVITGSPTKLRLTPVPTATPGGVTLQVQGLYKKIAPVITATNMYTAGTQVFDDEWFWVYNEGVLWKAYQYSDDARAGTITFGNDGKYQFTGQRAAFEAALSQMKDREPLPGDPQRIPPDVKERDK